MKAILMIFALPASFWCCGRNAPSEPDNSDIHYRQEMRDFVQSISQYAKNKNAGFLIIPQNGHEIITENSDAAESPDANYLDAIDGIGREDLLFGYEEDNQATPAAISNEIIRFLKIYENHNVEVLVTDYAKTPTKVDFSYAQNEANSFISFGATRRELDHIPAYPAAPFHENDLSIFGLNDAKNFLYLLDPLNTTFFTSKTEYLGALKSTNYDALIIDAFYNETILDQLEVENLKQKSNGGKRLVIAYMSIGEAEDYRYYWQSDWQSGTPAWLMQENSDWPGNYKVRYWQTDWQNIIFGNEDSYLKKIIDAGFDGVYLDIVDGYEYFEDQ